MSDADFVLKAKIDFGDVDKELGVLKKKLSDIQAKASGPGGSASRPGTSPSPRSNSNAVQSAIANERAYQAALTRTESMVQRISRQMDGNATMTNRARQALDGYSRTLSTFGSRSMEGVRASGEFSRAMNSLNHEIAKSNGLLVNLNRGFGSIRGELGTLAGAFGTLPAQVGQATAAVGALVSALGTLRAQNTGAALTEVGGGAMVAARGIAALSTAAVALVVVPAVIGAIGVAAYSLARPLAEASDKLNGLQARFTALTGSAALGAQTFSNMIGVAERLGVELDSVGSIFTRLTLIGQDIGLTTSKVRELSETLVMMGRLSGATTNELNAGLLQLSQALASGVLRGEELNSVLENTPMIAMYIAKSLGVGVGQLRAMGKEGQLTADIVLKALGGAADDVRSKFAQIPTTVSQMSANISTQWMMLLSNLDKTFGASPFVKNVLGFLDGALRRINSILNKSSSVRLGEINDRLNEIDQPAPLGLPEHIWKARFARERAELLKERDKLNHELLQSDLETAAEYYKAHERANQQKIKSDAERAEEGQKAAAELLATYDETYARQKRQTEELAKLEKVRANLTLEQYNKIKRAIESTGDAATTTSRAFSVIDTKLGSSADALTEFSVDLDTTFDGVDVRIRDTRDTTADMFDDMVRTVDRSFERALSNAGGTFEGFARDMVDTFKDMLGQMAYQALVRPPLVPTKTGPVLDLTDCAED